jgi:hypothetical protein
MTTLPVPFGKDQEFDWNTQEKELMSTVRLVKFTVIAG